MTKSPTRRAEPDFPSCPAVLPNFVLRSTNPQTGRLYITNTVSARAMRRIVDILREYGMSFFLDDDKDQVSKYVDPDPTDPYRLPENIERSVRQFASGQSQFVSRDVQPADSKGPDLGGGLSQGGGDKLQRSTCVVPNQLPAKAPARLKATPGMSVKDDVSLKLAELGKIELVDLARRNSVWDDKYEALGPGQFRMTVGNRLRGKIKRGESISWF